MYTPHASGCGPDFNERKFELNLDKPALVDKGGEIEAPDDPNARLFRAEPLGPAFKVTSSQPAAIRIDVLGCQANYTWSLDIHYSISGQEHQYVRTIGPLRTFGLAGSSTSVYSKISPDGTTYQFSQSGTGDSLSREWCK